MTNPYKISRLTFIVGSVIRGLKVTRSQARNLDAFFMWRDVLPLAQDAGKLEN